MATVPDALLVEPRLAQVYDPLHPDRSDLDVYVALVEELGARSVRTVRPSIVRSISARSHRHITLHFGSLQP